MMKRFELLLVTWCEKSANEIDVPPHSTCVAQSRPVSNPKASKFSFPEPTALLFLASHQLQQHETRLYLHTHTYIKDR